MEEIKSVLEKLASVTEKVNVDLVFGKPETVEGRTLIPVAELMYGFAAGAGAGTAAAPTEEAGPEAAEKEAEAAPTGSGAGGASGAKARPIAYIEVGPEGTKVQPIVDEQKIALAGIMMGAWVVGWIGMVLMTIFSPRRA
jgi:uncharacterized spore protein YtfJ